MSKKPLNQINFLKEESSLSGIVSHDGVLVHEEVFNLPDKVPLKKPSRGTKQPHVQQKRVDWFEFNSIHLVPCPDRELREKAMNLSQDPFWKEIEHAMFYRYFLYNPFEYTAGIRTLIKLYRKYKEEWHKTWPTPQEWVDCHWKSHFYTFKEARKVEQGALSEFTCRVCKKKGKVSVRSEQLRSLDEGQTVFYTCEEPTCGATWKE
jgi:DNA-directed RNA polymerase subunit M/transcription elongation factor TFIIS